MGDYANYSASRARASTRFRSVGTRYGPCIRWTLSVASASFNPTAETNSGERLAPRHTSATPARAGVARLGDADDGRAECGVQVRPQPGCPAREPDVAVDDDRGKSRGVGHYGEQAGQLAAVERARLVVGDFGDRSGRLAQRLSVAPVGEPEARRDRAGATVIDVDAGDRGAGRGHLACASRSFLSCSFIGVTRWSSEPPRISASLNTVRPMRWSVMRPSGKL